MLRRAVVLGSGIQIAMGNAMLEVDPRPDGFLIRLRTAHISDRRVTPLGPDGSVGRGRPPSRATLRLRSAMLQDKVRGRAKSRQEYVDLYLAAGGSVRGAKQLVRREFRRVMGTAHKVVLGRPASSEARLVRQRLASEPGMPLKELVNLLVSMGAERRAARQLVYREARRRKAG